MLHVPWMTNYQGLVDGDKPAGHFKYNLTTGAGPEIYNFKPQGGRLYGYAPVKAGTINISRLGASRDDDRMRDATVIWTASQPGVKSLRWIVGWYKNATIYRTVQTRPAASHIKKRQHVHYNVEADVADCKPLGLDDRTFSFQPSVKDRPGHAPAFFLSDSKDAAWIRSVRDYVDFGKQPVSAAKVPNARARGGGRQPDLEKRLKIEKASVEIVTNHYTAMKFDVDTREKERVGWDLDATKGDLYLRVEVKGVSGDELFCELTPNEYEKMNDPNHRPFYRICVVNDPLSKDHVLRVFSYSELSSKWVTEAGEILNVEPRIGGRCTLA